VNDDDGVDIVIDERIASGLGGRWYGVYHALVSDLDDPDHQGRVKVSLPWAPDTGSAKYEAWARLATMMAGNNRGSWFVPDTEDEVLVAFEAIRDAHDWRAVEAAGVDAERQRQECFAPQRRQGHRRRPQNLIAETPGGQKVTLKDGAGSESSTATATR
jgi:hypothetical protein